MRELAYRSQEQVAALQSEFVRRVYNWMATGLAITALVAFFTASSPTMLSLIFGNQIVFLGLILAELGLVIAVSAAINRLRASTATMLFFIYSALNGLTLSAVFIAYTSTSVANTFFVTAGTFAAMSLYGYSTKRDLTSWGSFLFMGLVGIIIASLVNFFMHSEAISWLISCAGVIVFVGLAAYDAQRIKAMALQGFMDEDTERKATVIGALALYLDFINLFLMLLRIFGRRD